MEQPALRGHTMLLTGVPQVLAHVVTTGFVSFNATISSVLVVPPDPLQLCHADPDNCLTIAELLHVASEFTQSVPVDYARCIARVPCSSMRAPTAQGRQSGERRTRRPPQIPSALHH